PTHRSYLDFVLVSLLCAAMRSLPGLSWLRVPKVAAADGPFGEEGTPLRWFMEKLGAFFIQRGKGQSRSALRRRLEALRTTNRDRSADSSSSEISQKFPRERERLPQSLGGGISRTTAPQNATQHNACIDPT
ncbi:unnamed protein product, partial [Laminaria digitata]